MSLNTDLADLFRTFAALMEIKGESVFKAIAFSKVSRLLDNLTVDVKQLYEQGKLGEIEGVGPSSQRIIEQFIRDGRSKDFDEVAATVPPGLLPMLAIAGLGPKTIALLWKERKIESIDDLNRAIAGGKLEGIKGLGEKKIESIKQGLAMRAQAGTRMGLPEAREIAIPLLEQLRAIPLVDRAEIAGSLRRWRETIGDVDLLATLKQTRKQFDPKQGSAVTAAFAALPQVKQVKGQGSTRASIVTKSGLQVDLRIVPAESFGAAMLYFTGSKDHNVRLRGLAQDKKMTLNEWGLYKLADYEKATKKPGSPPPIKPLASKTEADIYAKLGMEFIEPELREDRGEIDLALRHALPKLIEQADYRGDLHTHTTASDGNATIEQMAEAALARGYRYLAITDHSKSQVIANGLSAERLIKHAAAIRKAGSKLKGITLLAGCEVDILADGRLDFEAAVLAELDFVVASPHMSLKQDTQKATDRIVRAIETRYVNMIGHPTGRLIAQRAGLPLDFARVYQAAAATGTALEINGGYPRLDLDDVHARGAIAAGVMLAIDTDAHSTEGLGELDLGLSVARRAGAEAKNVINCMEIKALRGWAAKKR
jgi:DNA polymerase (family 10)